MKSFALVIVISMMLLSVLPAAAQVLNVDGPRSEVVYGEDRHFVTLTFYIGQNDSARLQEIVETLQAGNVSKAVFFLQPGIDVNVSNILKQAGYAVFPWNNTSQYDRNFVPSSFGNITLSDRGVLGKTDKMADVLGFFNLAIHHANTTIIAFTPSVPPQFNATTSLLEEILEDSRQTVVFTSEGNPSSPVNMGIDSPNIMQVTPIGANTTKVIEIEEGLWTMERLHQEYPSDIHFIQSSSGPGYLVDTTIIIETGARLEISGEQILLASPIQDKDRRIEVNGEASILNSAISSLDMSANRTDKNPYHQRPFIFVDEGTLDIRNSTITHLGFPIAGLSEERSARAALIFHDSSNFTIANSTLAFNFDAIYTRNSGKFNIIDNEIYGNTRSGIDLRTGSTEFVISGNHVHDNGYEGMMCAGCGHGAFTNNLVEHNREAGIKLSAQTNATSVIGNIIEYNEKFGVYLKDNSTNNIVRNNTITGGEEGITIAESSINNIIINNIVLGNDAIVVDVSSQANVIKSNRLNPTVP